ncbi:MAG TPA: NAD(P)/FAD-dependent oxidoreductase [Rhizobiaceae bacterium]|nr:NAD(P)/FAD-dependent oxidoreductase [Rhizobiaceae bacterium]
MTERAERGEGTFDVVVVGAGFAGLYMLHRLRKMGLRTRAYDIAGDVGGTWYWNRYPGARCDVESLNYSYSFDEDLQQEWNWTERFAGQSEILSYISHVADRFDLRRDIRFSTRVTEAVFDETAGQWAVATDRGDRVRAPWLIMASGCLSLPRTPDFPGLSTFKGRWFHTGRWPHEKVSFSTERVGVIGTGASGIQCIPMIAAEADRLHVFQRTPSFSLPARNAPMDKRHEADIKGRYAAYRKEGLETGSGVVRDKVVAETPLALSEEERNAAFERLWQKGGTGFTKAFADIPFNKQSNDIAADFVRQKIRSTVKDPAVAALLSAQTDPIGTRRVSLDTNYFETFNRANVTLVDVKSDPIDEITASGIRTRSAQYDLDTIVFATGYDAITGPLLDLELVGRDGLRLRDKWRDGPRTYLGLMTAGFPNLFTITGPGSPSVLTNMVVSIEQHVDFICGLLEHARTNGASVIEAAEEAEGAWVQRVNEVAGRTLHVTANSWYLGANVPGKPRIFMPFVGGFHVYRRICQEIADTGYTGFVMDREKAAA